MRHKHKFFPTGDMRDNSKFWVTHPFQEEGGDIDWKKPVAHFNPATKFERKWVCECSAVKWVEEKELKK